MSTNDTMNRPFARLEPAGPRRRVLGARAAVAMAALSLFYGACNSALPERCSTTAFTPVLEGGSRCVTLQRGTGAGVEDARIAERWPDTSYGADSAAFAGTVGHAERQMLIGFDLDALPVGADITKATLTLHRTVGGSSTITLHRITAPWDERSVTWNGFGNAFDRDELSRLRDDPAGAPGPASFDVTDLVRAWSSGGPPNHGVLLRQQGSVTAFATSEAEPAENRPKLEICFRAAKAGAAALVPRGDAPPTGDEPFAGSPDRPLASEPKGSISQRLPPS